MEEKLASQTPILPSQNCNSSHISRSKHKESLSHSSSRSKHHSKAVDCEDKNFNKKIKKRRGRKPKINIIRSPKPNMIYSLFKELEEPGDISLLSESQKGIEEIDLMSKFNQLEKRIFVIKQMTFDQIDGLKKEICDKFEVVEEGEVSNNVLKNVRRIVAEEVTKELAYQFDKMRDFFNNLKLRENKVERDKNQDESLEINKSLTGELLPLNGEKRRGRKPKIQTKVLSHELDINISSVEHFNDVRYTSPKAKNFTFSSFPNPQETNGIISSFEPNTNNNNCIDQIKETGVVNNKPLDIKLESEEPMRFFHNELDDTNAKNETRKIYKRFEGDIFKILRPKQEVISEIKNIKSGYNSRVPNKLNPEMVNEFDLNAFSLND